MPTQSPLPIDAIDVYRVEKTIDSSYRLSYGSITGFFATVYRVHSGGHCGVGEAIVTDHGLAIRLARPLIGRDCRKTPRILDHFDVTEFTHRACREALCFALYDLAGKADGVPIWDMLGGMRRESFPLRPVSFIRDAPGMAEDIRSLVAQGYKAVKIKLAGEPAEDALTLRKVRAACGPGVDIQADANLAYATPASCLDMLAAAREARLDIIEDPCDLDMSGYARLRDALSLKGVRLMLDHHARTAEDIRSICRHRAADIVNQHPNCQGGPDLLLAHQQIVRDAGLTNAIGGATGFFGISDICHYSAAAAIGAGAVEQTPTEMYQGIRLSPNPHVLEEGSVVLHRTVTGTGARLDEEAMQCVLVSQTRLGGRWRKLFSGWRRR